jgi:hypothetical protein
VRREDIKKSKKEEEEENQTLGATLPPQTSRHGRDGEGILGEGAAAALHLDEDTVAEVTAVSVPSRGGGTCDGEAPSRATGGG